MSGDAYPLSLDLSDRLVLVVGAGEVGARKAAHALDAGARVVLVAPDLSPAAEDVLVRPGATWLPGPYEPGLLDELREDEPVWLVHAATGTGTDRLVATEADRSGVWCVRADDARRSRAWNPAVARGREGSSADGVVVAVTGDADPRRSTAVRDAVQAQLDSASLPVARRRGAARPAGHVGRVALVGGGPGDPGLITVRGRELLATADVVITDRLGPTSLLRDLRAGVEVVDVGKQRDRHPVPQDEINATIVDRALRGLDVVRLKGGDPFVLGRGGEEALHCADHGIAVEVVPGITSAVSVPAAGMIPVTHRGITTSFVVASAHDGADGALDGLRDAPRDATLVLLMGVTALERTAESLVVAGRSPETPVAIVESGWTEDQRVTRTTLERAAHDAAAADVRPPAVVVVGEVVTVAEEIAARLARSRSHALAS